MRGIILLTALTLAVPAVPTIAAAQARVIVRDRPADVVVTWNRDRYDRYEDSRWHREFRGRWRPLASSFNARNERQFINVGGQGRFRKLRIESVRGEPVILKAVVEFADRTTQAIEYDQALPAGTGEVIDLNGDTRRINRIIVYTDRRSRGAYSVYGA